MTFSVFHILSRFFGGIARSVHWFAQKLTGPNALQWMLAVCLVFFGLGFLNMGLGLLFASLPAVVLLIGSVLRIAVHRVSSDSAFINRPTEYTATTVQGFLAALMLLSAFLGGILGETWETLGTQGVR